MRRHGNGKGGHHGGSACGSGDEILNSDGAVFECNDEMVNESVGVCENEHFRFYRPHRHLHRLRRSHRRQSHRRRSHRRRHHHIRRPRYRRRLHLFVFFFGRENVKEEGREKEGGESNPKIDAKLAEARRKPEKAEDGRENTSQRRMRLVRAQHQQEEEEGEKKEEEEDGPISLYGIRG